MGFYTTDTRKNYRKPEKEPESSGRTADPPEGDWPKQDETKHGDSDASTAGIVRGSKPREAAESAAGRGRSAAPAPERRIATAPLVDQLIDPPASAPLVPPPRPAGGAG